MRLINTKTGAIEEFIGDDIPKYAIFSHTWENNEISLQELQRVIDPDLANDPKTSVVKAKAGFIKILRFVELAASYGIPYAWADTCCIDKTSSADLTESINSMYRWYNNSEVCFAYLTDVISSEWPYSSVSEVAKSRWFTRGWTLQELIAPSKVEFYNHSWVSLGSKHRRVNAIESITGIDRYILESNDLSSANIARKMSWAANRTTTRKEDMAYCLLGLFDINMPLLYGEGEKAFLRLQEHIAVTSTDHSLFAWGLHDGIADETGDKLRSYRSIFARSPADFLECGKLKKRIIVHPDAWTQTNRGFHAVFPTIPSVVAKQLFNESGGLPANIDDEDYLVILNCVSYGWEGNTFQNHLIGIWISLIDARDDGKHGFCRVTDFTTRRRERDVSNLLESSPDKFRKDLWLATETIQVPRDYFSKRLGGFLIPRGVTRGDGSFQVLSVYGTRDSGEASLVSCPLLPLATLGGLVGVVTIKYRVMAPDENEYEDNYAVMFGYPQSLKKPFARVVYDLDDEPPLQRDLQRYALSDFDDDNDGYSEVEDCNSDDESCDSGHALQNSTSAISLSLSTVWHKGMIFTQLDIKLHTWF
jgi:hypothetical protein